MIPSRILIVDDDPNISDLVRLYLEQTHRFDVRVENRSAHGLSTARAFLPDMILMDVDMPGKDGGEVAREVQADRTLAGVPIVFLTSMVSRKEAASGMISRGASRYLAKPVNFSVLIDAVDRTLAAKMPRR